MHRQGRVALQTISRHLNWSSEGITRVVDVGIKGSCAGLGSQPYPIHHSTAMLAVPQLLRSFASLPEKSERPQKSDERKRPTRSTWQKVKTQGGSGQSNANKRQPSKPQSSTSHRNPPGRQAGPPQPTQRHNANFVYRPRAPAVRPVPWWERHANKLAKQGESSKPEVAPKGAMLSFDPLRDRRKKDKRKLFKRKKPQEPPPIVIPPRITVVRLAQLLGVKLSDVERVLTELGDPLRSEQEEVAADSAELAALELCNGRKVVVETSLPQRGRAKSANMDSLVPRPAVVTVMGHVDHGKTTLLDALRKTSVAAREAGGITQHVGAFEVTLPGSGRSLTFLDTPGHAAFSAMRARGAKVTDLVVLVVAADDGVMPQTKEALAHALAAGCPIVVAVTKCDVPGADPVAVRRQLAAEGLVVESEGGQVQCVEVSAVQGSGLVELEEALLIEAEVLDLKADPKQPAEGVVLEARMDRGQGPVATVIVTNGTLQEGTPIIVGSEWGKIKVLKSLGRTEQQDGMHGGSNGVVQDGSGVGPGRPAEIIGLKGIPLAGDPLLAVSSEDRAQKVSKARKSRAVDISLTSSQGPYLDPQPGSSMSDSPSSSSEMLNLVIKADVQGSLEAVKDTISTLGGDFRQDGRVGIKIIHAGVGPVTLSDVGLAVPSKAKIIAFNVKTSGDAESEARQRGIEIFTRRVIYELLGDVDKLIEGATPRVLQDVVIGQAEVLASFTVSVAGGKGSQARRRIVAGCRVMEGTLQNGFTMRVLRGPDKDSVVWEGSCDSLKRQKLDVDVVGQGAECGLGITGFDGFQIGDTIQCIEKR
jgi:translation initiation factor IF-2